MKGDSSCCQGGMNKEFEGSCMCEEENKKATNMKVKAKGKGKVIEVKTDEHAGGCCGH